MKRILTPSESATYTAYITSTAWQKRREIAIRRAGWRCEECGADSRGVLNVHHLTYDRMGAELDEDLQVLCALCHHEAHRDYSIDPDEKDKDWLNLERWPGPWPPPEWEAA